MILDIRIEDARWQSLDLAHLAEEAGKAIQSYLEIEDELEVSVLGCDDARIAALNGEFREKRKATNVLSWPAEDLSPEAEGARPERPRPDPHFPEDPIALGDVAIAYETCAREAREQGKPLTSHVTHLLVHGMLHLLGYDHIRDLDATLMEATEVDILGKLGVADPY